MPRLLKIETKNKIFELRKTGHSIPEISRIIGIPKSTALRYSRMVEILPEFLNRWLERRKPSRIISEKAWAIAHDKAKRLISTIDAKDRILVACALYWAEGNKKDLSFTNTDPVMVETFMQILRKDFNVSDGDFKVSIRIYEDLNQDNCINFWSLVTGLNLKERVSINILKGKKTGKLKYGMCRVRVKKSGLILKTIFAINKQVASIICPHSSTDRTKHS